MPEMTPKEELFEHFNETIATYGEKEGNAILHEVMNRVGEGAVLRDWMALIDEVALERHPYLRFAQERLD